MLAKLAWSYHRSTGHEFEELFGEACFAYARMKKYYDSGQSSFSTALYVAVSNRLATYQKRQKMHCARPPRSLSTTKTWHEEESGQRCARLENVEFTTPESRLIFRESIAALGRDVREIYNIVMSCPREFASSSSIQAQATLRQILRKRGWTKKRIRVEFNNITQALSSETGT
jgi:hypothetical protein